MNEWRFNRVKNFYKDPTLGPQGWYHNSDGSATITILRQCPVHRNDLRWINVFPE